MGKAGNLTYAKAGVDIFKEAAAISVLADELRLGERHYAGLIEFGEHYLTLCTDGVGSKVLVAGAMRNWRTIGIDCIAMNVNDCVAVGARPLAFVDYLALETLDEALVAEIAVGLGKGAELSGIPIIGGETATLPELINGFDLAGTCMGVVHKDSVIRGDAIRVGDRIIGLPSSGIHSNGLTLARKTFVQSGYAYTDKLPNEDSTVGDALLVPTKIYVREILELIDAVKVMGLAHITGSGLRKLMRLNKNVRYNIRTPFAPQPIFETIQELGGIAHKEMYQTFNMGMGFCVIVRKEDAENVLALSDDAELVGEVEKGSGVTVPKLNVKYHKY